MLSRLPITLAQLKAGNNSQKLFVKLFTPNSQKFTDTYCSRCTDQNNLPKQSTTI